MLKDCISPFFSKTKQIEELFLAEQPELDRFQSAISEWRRELFVLSCTENTIDLWEREFALEHKTNLTLEQRRARVFAKKALKYIPKRREIEERIRLLLAAEEVRIFEKDCTFEIYVGTYQLLDNFDIAADYFRKIRPAHFAYTFINSIERTSEAKVFAGIIDFKHKMTKTIVR